MSETKSETVRLELEELERDTYTQVRLEIDSDTVKRYAEAMRQGAIFPPVVVFYDGKKYRLADGWHRIHAISSNGGTTVEARVIDGSKDDALWYALGANREHGKQLSNDDKRRSVELALATPAIACKTDREIASHCGCSHKTVQKYRNLREESLGELRQNPPSTTIGTPNAKEEPPSYDAVDHRAAAVVPSDDDEPLEDLDEEESGDGVLKKLAQPHRDFHKHLTAARKVISDLSTDPELGGHVRLKITRITSDLEAVRGYVRQAEPAAWCEACEHKGCPACAGTGYLTRMQMRGKGGAS